LVIGAVKISSQKLLLSLLFMISLTLLVDKAAAAVTETAVLVAVRVV
jgi:hypothetical protein